MKKPTFQNTHRYCFTSDLLKENNSLKKYYFQNLLKGQLKLVDILSALHTFLAANDLPWEKVTGICIDGAQAMTGCWLRFIKLAKKKNPKIIGSQCILHRQAFACQTLSESLNVPLKITIKIVNHSKPTALNTRLFEALCQELNSDQDSSFSHRSTLVVQR